MFGFDDSKTQPKTVLTADSQPPGVIISPDTRRENRIPPGQSRTQKWPVLDAFGPPRIDLDQWKLSLFGLVNQPLELTWQEFSALPRIQVFADFHCVTRWSRLGNVWEGVAVKHLVELAGGLQPEAEFVLAYGYDGGWTTNLPVADFLVNDALVATLHDGQPLTTEHGAPARLIVPRLY